MMKREVRFSEEALRKISEANKGKHRSEETRRKMSEAHTGLHHSEETIKKLKKAWRRRKRNEH